MAVSTPADFIPVLLPLSSCLQKAERIPRNHVGASRGSPTCFACPSLSLSLSASPLLLFLSRRFISREIHTSGRLKDGGGKRERERGLVVTRGSHRLHRCWITSALLVPRLSYTAEEMLELERSKFDDKGWMSRVPR